MTIYSPFADILVRFTTTTFEMEEGSDQTEVCVIIDMGTVGEDGLVINIVDIIGGTATRKDYCIVALLTSARQ